MATKAAKKKRPVGRPRKNPKPASANAPAKPTVQRSGEKPLPPPLPIEGLDGNPNEDPFQLSQQFQGQPGAVSSVGSATSLIEPKPGEPLSPESERILQDVPDQLGDDPGGELEGDEPEGLDLSPALTSVLKEKYIRRAFEATYRTLARLFDSPHWELEPGEAQDVAEPATLVLQGILPAWLKRLSESTPGAVDLLFMMAIINAPRIAQQIEISRDRRSGTEKRKPGEKPRPINQQRGGPVGPIDTTIPIIPIDSEA